MKSIKILSTLVLTAFVATLAAQGQAQDKVKGKSKADKSSHIKLESNFIGDKEQPSVSYFIPWKEIGTPDKLLWDLDSKYDKTLSVIDREVLLRATGMYKEMNLESSLIIVEDK